MLTAGAGSIRIDVDHKSNCCNLAGQLVQLPLTLECAAAVIPLALALVTG